MINQPTPAWITVALTLPAVDDELVKVMRHPQIGMPKLPATFTIPTVGPPTEENAVEVNTAGTALNEATWPPGTTDAEDTVGSSKV